MSPPDDLDRLSPDELKGLAVQQAVRADRLQRLVAALCDEIARHKGGPGRAKIKPSRMDRGTEPKQWEEGSGGKKRRRGSTRSKLSIHEEQTIKGAAPPRGSRFKGYPAR